MNKRKLAYNAIKNQQQSSWIDDPFQLGTYVIKGFKPVDNAQALENYAQELISIYAKYTYDYCEISLSDIPEDEQFELARLYIDAHGRELTECVNGDDFTIENDFTCALLAMLKDNCKELREHFAQVTCNNILIFYHKALQELLDNSCVNYLNLINNEQGRYAHQDLDSGEIVWGKF